MQNPPRAPTYFKYSEYVVGVMVQGMLSLCGTTRFDGKRYRLTVYGTAVGACVITCK